MEVLFFLHINVYMFLKPANSDTENGIKKKNNVTWKKNHVQRKLKNRKSEKRNVPE